MKRACGFLPDNKANNKRVVWYRNGVEAHECPVSLITPQSIRWLDEWSVLLTMTNETEAKSWEAKQILDEEQRKLQMG
jgi:hypothetical protein